MTVIVYNGKKEFFFNVTPLTRYAFETNVVIRFNRVVQMYVITIEKLKN